MCDTAVALASVTKDHQVYFAKNSDRDVNEAQYLELVKGGQHAVGEKVKCTYVQIPQIKHTNTVLLSKPYWMWGAEMGVNEHGVAIGNEAVFTKLKASREPGLIGMDFLRLALERAASAEEALHVLIDLLETYGQSGNCAVDHELIYHNSFLIADRSSAWVLETADRQWAAKKVKDFYSISNKLTIGKDWDLASENLVRIALDKGWCKSKEEFHFADCYSDFLFTKFSQAAKRRSCSYNYLKSHAGAIDVYAMLDMLRTHNVDDEHWAPDRSLTEWTLCVHKGFGPVRASQSVASLMSRLSKAGDLHFVTGTSAPCLSLFKPVWLEAGLPEAIGPIPAGQYDNASIWWQHERLHRAVLKDFEKRSATIQFERDQFERTWIEAALQSLDAPITKKQEISEQAFVEGSTMTNDWTKKVGRQKIEKKNAFYYDMEWQKHNGNAGISL